MWNRQSDSPPAHDVHQRPPGVIDTIGIGFEAIVSRPVLIVPPVLLDLYFWLGVHITSRPLSARFADWLRGLNITSESTSSAIERRGLDNLSEMAAFWAPTVRVPSFVSTLTAETTYRLESWRPVYSLSWWGVLLAGVVLLIAGLFIGSEYLLAVAAATSTDRAQARRKPGDGVARGAWRLACWYAAIIGIGLLVLWPLLAGIVVADVSGAGASIWLVLMLILPVSWAFVLFFFSIQAMFVDGSGPLAAVRSSYRVVRGDSWNALGMIIAYFLLTLGFPQVWSLLISQPVGLVAAIVGHAIIATGMIAATMVFYRDRVQYLTVAGRIQEG